MPRSTFRFSDDFVRILIRFCFPLSAFCQECRSVPAKGFLICLIWDAGVRSGFGLSEGRISSIPSPQPFAVVEHNRQFKKGNKRHSNLIRNFHHALARARYAIIVHFRSNLNPRQTNNERLGRPLCYRLTFSIHITYSLFVFFICYNHHCHIITIIIVIFNPFFFDSHNRIYGKENNFWRWNVVEIMNASSPWDIVEACLRHFSCYWWKLL